MKYLFTLSLLCCSLILYAQPEYKFTATVGILNNTFAGTPDLKVNSTVMSSLATDTIWCAR